MSFNINNGGIDQKTISPTELGDLFGKSPRWSRKLIREKRIQAIKEFGSYMIPISEVDRILNSAERVGA